MKNIITISQFIKSGTGFIKSGEQSYTITYLKGCAKHHLNIVVDGIISKQSISLTNPGIGYKNSILMAISEYRNGLLKVDQKPKESKYVTLDKIKTDTTSAVFGIYKHNIENYILPISKEDNRDTLTKFNLL